MFDIVLNNQMVEGVSQGRVPAVRAMVQFGAFPYHHLDRVRSVEKDNGVVLQETERHSIWYWAHQAPDTEALGIWWDLHYRLLASRKSERERAELLSSCLSDAVASALQYGNPACLVETWRNAQEHTSQDGMWTRTLMRKIFVAGLARCRLNGPAVLQALHDEGLLSRADWSGPIRETDAVDPIDQALFAGEVDMLSTWMDVGAPMECRDGTPWLSALWRRLAKDPEGEPWPSPRHEWKSLLLLLSRQVNWHVPGRDGSVAEELVSCLPEWQSRNPLDEPLATIARLVEQRHLEEITPATKKAAPKRRL